MWRFSPARVRGPPIASLLPSRWRPWKPRLQGTNLPPMTDLSVLLHCEVHRGFGHWMRTKALAEAFAKRCRTTVALTSDTWLEAPRGVEMIRFAVNAHFLCNDKEGRSSSGG